MELMPLKLLPRVHSGEFQNTPPIWVDYILPWVPKQRRHAPVSVQRNRPHRTLLA
jgi:hypothetical protein